MRLIGLIGGMSWESSQQYYRVINEVAAQRLGGLSSARLVLYSLDFSEVELAQRQGDWDGVTAILVEAGKALKLAGADFLVLCTNTMHKVSGALCEQVGLPLLDIIEVIGRAIVASRLQRVGLLGTRLTMEDPFYAGRLRDSCGVEVLVPGPEERDEINRIIYQELCRGSVESSSRRTVVQIINGLVEAGAQGVVLGCTELPLLVGPRDVHVPLFDTSRLHAEAAVDMALSDGSAG